MALFDKYLTRQQQQAIKIKYMPSAMFYISKAIYLSCKNEFHISEYAKKNNFIACLWHGNFLMMPYLYNQIKEIPNMSLITSGHNDGAVVELYFKKFKLESIRGSTGIERGGTKALIKSIGELKNGRDIAVTPDGPKGPYKSIANGILLMAMKSGVGICGCKVKPTRYWELKTWDKFCIPKPFSKIDYYINDPLFLPKNTEIEKAKNMLKNYMEKLEEL